MSSERCCPKISEGEAFLEESSSPVSDLIVVLSVPELLSKNIASFFPDNGRNSGLPPIIIGNDKTINAFVLDEVATNPTSRIELERNRTCDDHRTGIRETWNHWFEYLVHSKSLTKSASSEYLRSLIQSLSITICFTRLATSSRFHLI